MKKKLMIWETAWEPIINIGIIVIGAFIWPLWKEFSPETFDIKAVLICFLSGAVISALLTLYRLAVSNARRKKEVEKLKQANNELVKEWENHKNIINRYGELHKTMEKSFLTARSIKKEIRVDYLEGVYIDYIRYSMEVLYENNKNRKDYQLK